MSVPRTITGVAFSPQNGLMLQAIQRARGYAGGEWVAAPLMSLLGLVPHAETENPVRLSVAGKTCTYYHVAQLARPLDEVRRRWEQHARLFQEEEDDEVVPALPREAPCESPEALTTNGESFLPEVASRMAAIAKQVPGLSRYWATPDEASFIYQNPFTQLEPRLSAAVPLPYAGVVATYYNVALTRQPHRFTEATCRRYDPVNYHGLYYRPFAATAMKREAVAQGCLDQPRWVTVGRARRARSKLKPHVVPIELKGARNTLRLVNINLTEHPNLIERGFCDYSHLADDDSELLLQSPSEAAAMASSDCAMPLVDPYEFSLLS